MKNSSVNPRSFSSTPRTVRNLAAAALAQVAGGRVQRQFRTRARIDDVSQLPRGPTRGRRISRGSRDERWPPRDEPPASRAAAPPFRDAGSGITSVDAGHACEQKLIAERAAGDLRQLRRRQVADGLGVEGELLGSRLSFFIERMLSKRDAKLLGVLLAGDSARVSHRAVDTRSDCGRPCGSRTATGHPGSHRRAHRHGRTGGRSRHAVGRRPRARDIQVGAPALASADLGPVCAAPRPKIPPAARGPRHCRPGAARRFRRCPSRRGHHSRGSAAELGGVAAQACCGRIPRPAEVDQRPRVHVPAWPRSSSPTSFAD